MGNTFLAACFIGKSLATPTNIVYAECLIGKTVVEAEAFIEKENVCLDEKNKDTMIYEIRVINEGSIFSQDGCEQRLNVSTRDDIITEILWVG